MRDRNPDDKFSYSLLTLLIRDAIIRRIRLSRIAEFCAADGTA